MGRRTDADQAVLPIGGGREEMHAARRQKLFELTLPDNLKEGITVHFAKRFSDVAKILF
ncbi:hypothetical protein [Pseudomonas sp. NPDC099000]|uniref:hypothetical protein n=1 Tax=Pseudomonas sp. NPDC099000 TaxID=3364488 RepID=UPI00383AFD57